MASIMVPSTNTNRVCNNAQPSPRGISLSAKKLERKTMDNSRKEHAKEDIGAEDGQDEALDESADQMHALISRAAADARHWTLPGSVCALVPSGAVRSQSGIDTGIDGTKPFAQEADGIESSALHVARLESHIAQQDVVVKRRVWANVHAFGAVPPKGFDLPGVEVVDP